MSWRSALVLALLLFGCSQERARDLQLGRGAVHEAGVQDPTSEKFHGRLLSASGYDFAQCATCHGSDFSGGKAKKSCLGCHQEGPTACTTCHRGPAGGAHAVHASGALLGRSFACSECHVQPASWDAAGHIRDARGVVDARPAEVQFGALAGAAARFDASTGGCAGVTCHGGQAVSWRAGTPATCGSCHGVPPASHADDRCSVCHAGAGDDVRSPLHVDGVVQIGHGRTDCAACHGGVVDASGAPPPDLSGRFDRASLGVGAHVAHIKAGRLSGPVACESCHVVPATLASPGHIDSAAPAEVSFGGLARARGAQPVWQRASATCAGVYCHGSVTPSWSGGPDEATCGTCHGVPPSDSSHVSTMTLRDCVTCHPRTVDGFGSILFNNGMSEHIDGTIDGI